MSAHRASLVRAYRFSLLIILIFCGCLLGGAQGQGASMHGTVIALAGSPVPQALVTIEGPSGGQAATTNMMGKYAVHGLNPGKYKVTITGSGYETFVVEVSLMAGLDQEIDAVLMVPKALPQPPAAAEVPATETPQENGSNPKPAEGAPAQQNTTQQTSTQQTTTAVKTVTAVTAKRGRAALSGVVTDQSGAVVSTGVATLIGTKGSLTATASTSGQYVFPELEPGTYKLSVTATG